MKEKGLFGACGQASHAFTATRNVDEKRPFGAKMFPKMVFWLMSLDSSSADRTDK